MIVSVWTHELFKASHLIVNVKQRLARLYLEGGYRITLTKHRLFESFSLLYFGTDPEKRPEGGGTGKFDIVLNGSAPGCIFSKVKKDFYRGRYFTIRAINLVCASFDPQFLDSKEHKHQRLGTVIIYFF